MKKPEFNGGVIINIDFNSVTFPFLAGALAEANFSEEHLYPFVDQYADTQVTTLAFNTASHISATRSNVTDDVLKVRSRKVENGVAVDYSHEFQELARCYEEFNIDPYAVWIKRCRQKGLEAWLSFRMNDAHHVSCETHGGRHEFFYEAKANGWLIGKTESDMKRKELHNCAYNPDYSYPKVRQLLLDYTAEQLDRYDVDGLELDFTRECICFDYVNNAEKVEIMNSFIRETKKIVAAAEEKWGRKIKLVTRLPMNIEQCLMYGFDVRTWDKEQLVDHICISTRYESCCNDMEIDKWKAALPHTEISAGMENHCLSRNHPFGIGGGYDPLQRAVRPRGSTDTINGLAAAYACQGMDAMYLYNYFMNPYVGQDDSHKARTLNLIHRIGSADTIFASPRRYIIMYQDYAPYGYERYCPLPVSVDAGNSTTLSLPVGYVPEGDKAHFVIGMSKGTPVDAEVLVNGKACEKLIACDAEALLALESGTPGISYAQDYVTLYMTEIFAESRDRYTIEITAKADVTVDHIEVDIQ